MTDHMQTLKSVALITDADPSDILGKGPRGDRVKVARGMLVDRLRRAGWKQKAIGDFMGGRSAVAVCKIESQYREDRTLFRTTRRGLLREVEGYAP